MMAFYPEKGDSEQFLVVGQFETDPLPNFLGFRNCSLSLFPHYR